MKYVHGIGDKGLDWACVKYNKIHKSKLQTFSLTLTCNVFLKKINVHFT